MKNNSYCVPGTVLYKAHLRYCEQSYENPHFTDEETVAQTVEAICPKTHSLARTRGEYAPPPAPEPALSPTAGPGLRTLSACHQNTGAAREPAELFQARPETQAVSKTGQRGQEQGAQAVDRAWESTSAPPPLGNSESASQNTNTASFGSHGVTGQSAVTSGTGALTSWVLRKQILPDQETAQTKQGQRGSLV